MHPLLKRQLRKAFKTQVPEDPATLELLRLVEEAYTAADEDRKQLERSLGLASDELFERNVRLENELEERKRLEIELQIAEKLRAVGQLAAGIAHEINTPIQFMGDSLSFLSEAFDEMDPLLKICENLDEARQGELCQLFERLVDELDLPFLRERIPKAIARCQDGVKRVATIVHAMKTLAHPSTHSQEAADINAAVRNTLVVLQSELEYVADIELELAATRQVLCNVGEIQQVLLSLIINAAQAIGERFAEAGGRGKVRVTTRDDGPDVVIIVQDDGGGIPPAIQGRIYEPFFTTKPVGRGTGQGLSIARSLVVDRHQGQLSFQSVVGEGSVFTVRLPVNGRSLQSDLSLQDH